MTYTTLSLVGLAVALTVDLALLRTSLLRRRVFWVSYAIVAFFQLVTNGILAGRQIVRYDVNARQGLANPTVVVEGGTGALDGFKVDEDGNLWCGWGSTGAADSVAADLDGVMVFNPQGKPIGFIKLPERCANLTFGGPKNNRLYMASCHSVYALYVESHGAV